MQFLSFLFILLFYPVLVFCQNSLTLNDCIQIALENNIELNQQKLETANKKILLREQEQQLYPSINANGSHSYNWGRAIDPFTNQFTNNRRRTNNFSVSAQTTLFQSGKIKNTTAQSEIDYEAAKYNEEIVRQDIILNVVAAYLQILLVQEQVSVAKNQIERSVKQLEDAEEKFEVGILSKAEIIQLQAQKIADINNARNLQSDLTIAKLSLSQLLNVPFRNDFSVYKPDSLYVDLLDYETLTAQTLYSEIEAERPEVVSAALNKEAANLGVKIAKAEYSPTLTVSGSLISGYSSTSSLRQVEVLDQYDVIGFLENDPSTQVISTEPTQAFNMSDYPFADQLDDNFSQSIALSLSIPIYNNRRAKSLVGRAKINQQSAELAEKQTLNQLREEIEGVFVDFQVSKNNYLSQKENLFYKETIYRNNLDKYDVGLINAFEILQSQADLSQAESDYVRSKYEYVFNSKLIDFYMGNPITLNQTK
ncbi:MAG: TolC family protein [Bacteroidota bacterium]